MSKQPVAAAGSSCGSCGIHSCTVHTSILFCFFFSPLLSSFFYPQELAQSDKLRRELIPFKVYEGEAEKNQRCVPTKNHLPPLFLFFFPQFFFLSPIPNLCLQPSTLVDSHFYLHPRCLRRPSRELLRSNSKVVLYELEAMVKEWIKEVILSKVRDHDNYDTSKAHSKENGHDTSRHRAAGAALHAPALVSAPGSHWHSFFAQILKYKRSQTQNNHIMIFNRSPFLPCGALALSLSLPLSRSLALSLPPSPSSFIAFPTAYLSGRKDRAFLSIATTKPPRLWHMIVPSRVFSFFF